VISIQTHKIPFFSFHKRKKEKSLVCVLSALWAVLLVTFVFAFPIVLFQNGKSMEPTYPEEFTVILSSLLPENLTDMIVVVHLSFYNGDLRIAHRVVWDNGSFVQTKGDANLRADPILSPHSNVEGVVIFESYNLKYVYAVCLSGLLFVDLIVVFSLFEKRLKAVSDYVNKAVDRVYLESLDWGFVRIRAWLHRNDNV